MGAHTSDRYKERTAHFITHWGVPKDIVTFSLFSDTELAVLIFAPARSRSTWRYATNGMSEYNQHHTDRNLEVRTELYVCSGDHHAWIPDLLFALARYPKENETHFSEYDTISLENQIGPGYRGILLAPPSPIEPETLGANKTESGLFLVHQVVGIFESELEFAIDKSGEELWRRLQKLNVPLLIDQARSDVFTN